MMASKQKIQHPLRNERRGNESRSLNSSMGDECDNNNGNTRPRNQTRSLHPGGQWTYSHIGDPGSKIAPNGVRHTSGPVGNAASQNSLASNNRFVGQVSTPQQDQQPSSSSDTGNGSINSVTNKDNKWNSIGKGIAS